ncbi:retrovirus-related pol polyprotein from transposon TNT 1-94 [Tanacetum coccineum]
MNRTLVERVRCLLSHAGLPASFWDEALNTAIHVINLTPCVPLRFDVPDRVWSGKDVSYRHLRVFGCKAFVHIPKDERSKLDVKTKPCVFLGYGQDEFGYRLYDPVQKRLVRSRDVVEKTFGLTVWEDDIQNDEEQGADDVDAQEQPNLDEDVHPELPVPDMPPFLPLRRSTRDHHPSTRYSAHEYVLLTDRGEPKCYAEAMEDEHKKEWFEAMEDEMNSLHENNTFELVKLPKGKRALKNKWVYKLKTDEHTLESLEMGSIRVVLGLAASLDLEVEQMDVKTVFFKGSMRFYMDKAKVVSSPLTTNFKLTDKDCPSSKKNIEKMDRVPYASVVGSLMYAMKLVNGYLISARYFQIGVSLFGNGKPMLVGFIDSDMAGNKDNMKSTSGYLMTFAGGAVSWQSRLQKCVALSTTEAEYMAATEACKELLWLKRFLQELGFKQQRYAVLCDNQSAIHLAKNSMFHKRTKHIDIRYHWIRDAIEDGMFELNKVHTDDNASDMLTKAVAREKLRVCSSIAGMANSSS